MKKGMVYLVGAGPGDPGLFTIKGRIILNKADVVVYDRLVSPKILEMAPEKAEMIYVGKNSGRHAMKQEEINATLVKHAQEGKTVVRLKGGDPFLFGRGGEEAQTLKEYGLSFEIIPGITSAIAVPAYAGIPVTHRDHASTLTIITGHEKPNKQHSSINWEQLAKSSGTLVFLMGIENLELISGQLIANGMNKSTPIALIRWGTWPKQEVLVGNLANILTLVREKNFMPPAVIVVGDVVKLREELAWVEKKPLWGQKIVITRSRPQASELADRVIDLGGDPIEFPTITIKPSEDMSELYKAFDALSTYDWIIFTSANAVDIFMQELLNSGYDIRDLKGIEIAAIGPATSKKLQQLGLKVSIVPDEFRAEAIVESLRDSINSETKVLLPRAKGARAILPDSLKALGAAVNEVLIYEAVMAGHDVNGIISDLIAGNFDFVTFTSSSTVENFVKIVGSDSIKSINENLKIACIGPITAETARSYGFDVDIMAAEYTIPGLINAIVADLVKKN